MKASRQEQGLQRAATQSDLVGMLGAPRTAAAQRPRCAGGLHREPAARFCVATGASGQRDLFLFWGGSDSWSVTTRISTGHAIFSYLQLFIYSRF